MMRVRKNFIIDAYSLSDQGLVRPNNEDAYIELPECNFFMLADGMGGHNAGEVASKEAVSTLSTVIKKRLKRSFEVELTQTVIHDAIQEVNLLVHAKGHSRPEYHGMGTTLCCAHFHPEGLVIGHVGDSRIYLMRSGRLVQLTRDHSLVMDLVDRGRMSEREAIDCQQKNIITKAIGTEPVVDPTVEVHEYQAGDQLLMCTDGLSDLVAFEEIQEMMASALSLKESVQKLIQLANQRGGHDNITVIQVQVKNAEKSRNLSR